MSNATTRAFAFRSHETARSTSVNRSRSERSDGDVGDVMLHIYHRHFLPPGSLYIARPLMRSTFSLSPQSTALVCHRRQFEGVSARASRADRCALAKACQDLSAGNRATQEIFLGGATNLCREALEV